MTQETVTPWLPNAHPVLPRSWDGRLRGGGCLICRNGTLEDAHFLLSCPAYARGRRRLVAILLHCAREAGMPGRFALGKLGLTRPGDWHPTAETLGYVAGRAIIFPDCPPAHDPAEYEDQCARVEWALDKTS